MPHQAAIDRPAAPRPIAEVARELGLEASDLHPQGRDVAKVDLAALRRPRRLERPPRLVLISAITPTPAGEGKTTTSIGLAQGLCRLGKSACLSLREPSLGPVFGMKGGATGGGRSQILPRERGSDNPMRILIPDAQFSGPAHVEQAVFGAGSRIDVCRAVRPDDIRDDLRSGCDAILLWHVMPIDREVAARLDRCRIVVRCGIGYDRVDVAACAERGIPVCNLPSFDM